MAEREKFDAVRFDRDQLVIVRRRLLRAAEQCRLRRAIDVGVDQPDLLPAFRQCDGEVGGNGRLSDTALAAADRDQGPRDLRRGDRDARLGHPGNGERGLAQLALERFALLGREPGRVGNHRRDTAGQLARADAFVVRQVGQRVYGMGHGWSHKKRAAACHCFSCRALPIHGP